jgi:hypothetical protein
MQANGNHNHGMSNAGQHQHGHGLLLDIPSLGCKIEPRSIPLEKLAAL